MLVDELVFVLIDALVVVLVQILGYVLVEALAYVPVAQHFRLKNRLERNGALMSCVNLWNYLPVELFACVNLWCKADCKTQSLQVVHLIQIFGHGALEKYSKIHRVGEYNP